MRFASVSAMQGLPWGGSEERWSRAALRLREGSHNVAASLEFSHQLSTQITGLAEGGIRLWVRCRVPPSLPVRVWRRITLPLRVANRLCNALRWRLFSWLRSGYVQKLVPDQGPFYLANFFVLKKKK